MNLKEINRLNEQMSERYQTPINFIFMNRSDHYPAAYFRSSLFILALTYLIFYFIPFDVQDPIWMIGLSVPAVFIGQLLPLSSRYKRIFISNGEMKEECYQQALEQGYQMGVLNSPDSIYIYLSEFERRIELFIPDNIKGLNVIEDIKPHFKKLVKGLKAHKRDHISEALQEFYEQILILPEESTPKKIEEVKDSPIIPYNVGED